MATSKRKSFKLPGSLKASMQQTTRSVQKQVTRTHLDQLPITLIDIDENNDREHHLTPDDFVIENGDAFECKLNIGADDPVKELKMQDVEDLKEMADSIRKKGVMQSVAVYKNGDRYKLIAGERRLLGSFLSSSEFIPANIYPEKPRSIKVLQFIENIHNKSLKPKELLNNIEGIINEENLRDGEGKVSPTALANAASISVSWASKYIKILEADKDLRDRVMQNKLSINHAYELIGFDAESREKLLNDEVSRKELAEKKREFKEKEKEKKQEAVKHRVAPSPAKPKIAGRAATKVNLGDTKNKAAVKDAIKALLPEDEAREIIAETDWDEFKSVTRAFKKAWVLFETMSEAQSE